MPGFLAEVLTKNENKWVISALKTSRSWGVCPLEILLGESSEGWRDERNRLLAMALTLLEEETCSHCGTPAWIGHSTDNEIVFDVKSTVCYGCAELERDQDSRKGKKNLRGVSYYTKARSVWEEGRLPSRKESYQRMRQEDDD